MINEALGEPVSSWFFVLRADFCQTFGEITGGVRDSAGSVIVGAKVTVTNTATSASRETVTTGASVYSFPSLQPGIYGIRVEQRGFRAAVENNIELQVQQTARGDVTLQVGQLTESIEVAAAAIQLNSDGAHSDARTVNEPQTGVLNQCTK
jgi:hypothetical protein